MRWAVQCLFSNQIAPSMEWSTPLNYSLFVISKNTGKRSITLIWREYEHDLTKNNQQSTWNQPYAKMTTKHWGKRPTMLFYHLHYKMPLFLTAFLNSFQFRDGPKDWSNCRWRSCGGRECWLRYRLCRRSSKHSCSSSYERNVMILLCWFDVVAEGLEEVHHIHNERRWSIRSMVIPILLLLLWQRRLRQAQTPVQAPAQLVQIIRKHSRTWDTQHQKAVALVRIFHFLPWMPAIWRWRRIVMVGRIVICFSARHSDKSRSLFYIRKPFDYLFASFEM